MVCVGQTLVTFVALAGAQLPDQALLPDDYVFSAVSNLTALTWRIERRLATEAMDFTKLCQSPCWSDMTTGMLKMYKNMESMPECQALMATPMCGVTTTITTTTTTTPSQCTKDKMAKAQLWAMGKVSEYEGCKKTLAEVMVTMMPATVAPGQKPGLTTTMPNMMESMCAVCTSPMIKAMVGGAGDPCITAMINMQSP